MAESERWIVLMVRPDNAYLLQDDNQVASQFGSLSLAQEAVEGHLLAEASERLFIRVSPSYEVVIE